jgi:hypothetical protein
MPKNATRQALAQEAKNAKNRSSAKTKKEKLSPAERSQIARDRWAKIRKAKAQEPPQIGKIVSEEVRPPFEIGDTPAPPVVISGRFDSGAPSIVGLGDGTIAPNGAFVPDQPLTPAPPPVDHPETLHEYAERKYTPAPQLAPVAPKKPKRYTGPKEFSVALKAAEMRLAKAINERAEAMGKLAGLNAEIPSLLQIIQALKGSNNLPPAPYDFSGSVPNAIAFQAPIAQPFDPQAAIMAAMAQPPVSRAKGNAVELSPDVVGSLEGPDDDNPDKYITGPAAGGSGWIGG